MTTRIYYTDSQARSFDARVESCERVGERFDVRLDRTAFYPTSGGQPFDTGRLGSTSVIDVIDRDGVVSHIVSEPLTPGRHVHGEIDWPRRLDHMAQHTGQHILSAAFEQTSGVATVGFHMGPDVSTIDLAREVTAAEIAAAEDEANRVIREDRPVSARLVGPEEAARLPLRRESTRSEELRIVEVAGFDLSACGGTHVTRTGEVGVVVSTGRERVRKGTRLSFLCGGRAVAGFRRVSESTREAARLLGVAPLELAPAVSRTQQALRQAERQLRRLTEEVTNLRVAAWRGAAERIGRHRVVLAVAPAFDAAALAHAARALVTDPGHVVILLGEGDPVPVVVARSVDADLDAAQLVKLTAASFGGRGGGRSDFAQGVLTGEPGAITAFVRRAIGDAS